MKIMVFSSSSGSDLQAIIDGYQVGKLGVK